MLRISRKQLALALSVVGWTLLVYGSVRAGDLSDARSLGMGTAFTAVARGSAAPQWNPANLALNDDRNTVHINLFGVGLGMNNSSFSLSDYNTYNGAYLTDSDKEAILDRIPNSGFNLDALADLKALSFSVRNFAFNVTGRAAATATLPKDPFELILYGNSNLQNISMDDLESESYGLADAGISYARAVREWADGEFTVGATFHYLRGLAYERVVRSEGMAATTDSSLEANGELVLLTSLGGTGYASDIGTAVRFRENWTFSAGLFDLFYNMRWTDNNEEIHFLFEVQPLNSESIDNDSLVTSEDTSFAAEAFSSRLAPTWKSGLAYSTEELTVTLDYEQGLSEGHPGSNVDPKLGVGAEYRGLGFLTCRGGLSVGGTVGSMAAVGFGVGYGSFRVDLAGALFGALWPSQAEGVGLAISSSLAF